MSRLNRGGYVQVEVTAMEVVTSRRHHQLIEELQPISCVELSVPPRLSIDNIKMVIFRAGVAELRGQHPDRWRLAIQPDPEKPPIQFSIEFLVLNKCHPTVSRRCILRETIELLLIPKGLKPGVGMSSAATQEMMPHTTLLSPRRSDAGLESIEKPRLPARYKLQTQSATQDVWEVDVDQLEVVALAPTGEDLAKQAEYEARVQALQAQVDSQQQGLSAREREAAQLRERVHQAESEQQSQRQQQAQIARLAETTAQRLQRTEEELIRKEHELEAMRERLRHAEESSSSKDVAESTSDAAHPQPLTAEARADAAAAPPTAVTAPNGTVSASTQLELERLRGRLAKLDEETRRAEPLAELARQPLLSLLERIAGEVRALSRSRNRSRSGDGDGDGDDDTSSPPAQALSGSSSACARERRSRSNSGGIQPTSFSPSLSSPHLRRSVDGARSPKGRHRAVTTATTPGSAALSASNDFEELASEYERLQEEYDSLAQMGQDAHQQFLEEQHQCELLRSEVKTLRTENHQLCSTAEQLAEQLADAQKELAIYSSSSKPALGDLVSSQLLSPGLDASGLTLDDLSLQELTPFVFPTMPSGDEDNADAEGIEGHGSRSGTGSVHEQAEGDVAHAGQSASARELALEVEHADDDDATKLAKSYLRRLRMAKENLSDVRSLDSVQALLRSYEF